ncbi:hypothetical protein [Lysinibacillus agricola]|uniref:hypothetical protein n=1 Tax=Lysinibacillus agricola TaxID=2590012 RepID=UPI003C25AE9A
MSRIIYNQKTRKAFIVRCESIRDGQQYMLLNLDTSNSVIIIVKISELHFNKDNI